MIDLVRLLTLHSRLQITISLVLVGLVLWAGVIAMRGGVGPRYEAALAVAALLLLAEAGLGLVLIVGGFGRTELALHLIYGLTLAVAIPALRRYNRAHPPQKQAWIYALAGLVLLGMVLRMVATG